jgi:outer membrane protein OmpU
MKKSLLATSALVAFGAASVAVPAAAADGFEVKLTGFMEQWFGYSDSSNTAEQYGDMWIQHSDDEFHISFKQTLDNGITVGGVMEIEGEAAGVDEQYAYLEGSFGKIIAGAENNAPYLMHYGVKSNGIGIEEGDGGNAWIAGAGGSARTRTNVHLGAVDDRNTVTYMTPRVNGIQIGASYTPQADTDTRTPGGTFATNEAREDDGIRDNAWGVGANYEGNFADMSVKIAAGYTDGGDDKAATVTGENTALTGAIQLGMGGFTFSLAYGENEKDDGTAYDLNNFATSIAYSAGPTGVSLAYLRSEDSDGDDKQDQVELGASYAVGPGVKAAASIYWLNRVNDGNTVADGVAVAGGLALTF